MTTYLFHTTLLLSGFTLFYWLVLRRETYFRLNRWVILSGVLFCLALPMIKVPAYMSLWKNTPTPAVAIMETISQAPAQIIATDATPSSVTTKPTSVPPEVQTATDSSFSWMAILTILYVVGFVIFFLVFLIQVVVLLTQRYNLNSFQTGKYRIVEMIKDTEPCSFLNYIFINPAKYDPETYDHIIEHEKAHIDQSHFVDKIIAELLVAVFWFNPFTWLLRKSISQNLEFLTDRSLLNQGIQKQNYQMSLLKVSVSNRPLNLTASYNSSFLKSRINMMNTKNSSIVSAWKYLFILPLFILSVASLNAVQGDKSNTSNAGLAWKSGNKEAPSQKSNATAQPTISPDEITRELDLPFINKIGLGISGNLIISYGKEQKVSVTGPKDLVDQISTVVHIDDWNVTYKDPGYRSNSNRITIHAQLTDLMNVALSGTGNIKSSNRFENLQQLSLALSGAGSMEIAGDAKVVSASLSGTGNIEVKTHAERITTALSGTGNITLIGQADNANFACSGSGNVGAKKLKTKTSKVTIDGSSSITVNASELLDVTANGNTVINYLGSPKIKKELKSESRLIKIN